MDEASQFLHQENTLATTYSEADDALLTEETANPDVNVSVSGLSDFDIHDLNAQQRLESEKYALEMQVERLSQQLFEVLPQLENAQAASAVDVQRIRQLELENEALLKQIEDVGFEKERAVQTMFEEIEKLNEQIEALSANGGNAESEGAPAERKVSNKLQAYLTAAAEQNRSSADSDEKISKLEAEVRKLRKESEEKNSQIAMLRSEKIEADIKLDKLGKQAEKAMNTFPAFETKINDQQYTISSLEFDVQQKTAMLRAAAKDAPAEKVQLLKELKAEASKIFAEAYAVAEQQKRLLRSITLDTSEREAQTEALTNGSSAASAADSAELEAMRAEIETLKAQIEQLQTDMQVKDALMAEMTETSNAKIEFMRQLDDELNNLKQALLDADQTTKSLNDEVESLKNELSNSLLECQTRENQLLESSQSLEAKTEAIKQLEEKLASAEAALRAAEERNANDSSEAEAALSSELADAKKEIARLVAIEKELNDDIAAKSQQIEQHQFRFQQLVESKQKLEVQLSQERDSNGDAVERYEKDIEQERSKTASLQGEIDAEKQKVAELNASIEKLTQQYAEQTEQQRQQQQTEIDKYKAEIQQLESEITSLRDRIQQQNSASQNEVAESQQQYNSKLEALETQLREKESAIRDIEAQQTAHIATYESRIADLQQKIESLQKTIEEMSALSTEDKKQSARMQQQLEEKAASIIDLQQQLKSLEADKNELAAALQTAKSALTSSSASLEKQLQQKDEELQQIGQQVSDLKQQVVELQKQSEEHAQESKLLRQQQQQQQQAASSNQEVEAPVSTFRGGEALVLERELEEAKQNVERETQRAEAFRRRFYHHAFLSIKLQLRDMNFDLQEFVETALRDPAAEDDLNGWLSRKLSLTRT